MSLKDCSVWLPRRRLAAASLIAVGSAVIEMATLALLVPLFQLMIDGGLADGVPARAVQRFALTFGATSRESLLGVVALLLVATTCTRVVFDYVGGLMMSRVTHRFVSDLRSAIWERMLRSGRAYLDRTGNSKAHAVMLAHTYEISGCLGALKGVVTGTALAVAYGVTSAIFSAKLLILCALLYPVYRAVGKRLSRSIEFRAEARRRIGERHIAYVDGSLAAMSLLQSANLEEREAHRQREIARASASADIAIDKRMLALGSVQELLLPCLVVGLFFIVRSDGGLTSAQALVFLLAVRRMSGQMSSIFASLAVLRRMRPLVDAIEESMRLAEAERVPSGTAPVAELRQEIRISGLTFGYEPGASVLRAVSLAIPAGKRTAIVGPSGSGKSTLLQLLLRLYDVAPRTVFIDGRDLRDSDVRAWRALVGYVSQDAILLNETLRDNLRAFASEGITDEALLAALRSVRFPVGEGDFARGLDARLGDGERALSGGERQRLVMARALVRRPQILLLDEPTSALDAAAESAVGEAIRAASAGRTLVTVSHRIATVVDYDHVVVLDHGRILESGAPAELLRRGGYFAKTFEAQTGAATPASA